MTTKVRLRELCEINNHIFGECDKMMQYLQIIKEKSEYAITFLNSLNTANILRRYSTTYEYLNKFYIKLLDQNCLFELFFLELNESTATNLLSAQSSVQDLITEPANFDSRIRNFSEAQEPHIHHFNNATSFVQHNGVNVVDEGIDDISSKVSGITRTRETKFCVESINNMNVNAREFYPRRTSTTSLSSRDIVIENSSISSKSDTAEPPKMGVNNIGNSSSIDTAEVAKVINILSEKNVAQHNLHSTSTNINICKEKMRENPSKKEKNTTLDMFSVSSLTSETNDNYIEKKVSKNHNDDDKDLIDLKIKTVIKNVNDKIRANELKSSVRIPNLRPLVVRNDTESSTSSQTHQSNRSPAKNSKHVNKKTNHNHSRTAHEIIQQNIVLQRGPTPQEGELCCISSIDSLSSFYIHVIRDDTTLIDTLSQQIAEISHSLRSFHNKKEARKCIKHYCVCYINAHSSWCRVEITNWMIEHDQMIEVRLIDYGLTCRVPLRNIREAIHFFFVLPAMAEKCELAWVKPLNKREEWSSESIAYFNKMVADADRLFTISYVEEEGDHLIIDLQTIEIHSIAGLMIADGKAADNDESDDNKKWSNEFMRKQIMKSQGFNEQEINQTEEDRLAALMFDDDDDDEVSNPNLAVSHYNPRDEKEICRIFLAKGHCFKGNNCAFSHKPLNPDGWTTDREAVFYDAFNQLQLPQTGSEITVKILHIADLRSFYVVIKNLPECINLIGLPVYNIRSLVKLMNDAEEIKSYKHLTVIPALGEIILAKYEDTWQRGRVVGMDEYAYKVELEVLLVDLGITKKFNMKNCRKIMEKHLHVPFQVVLCSLCNASMKEHLSEELREIGCDYLEMNVENKKLKAKVIYTSHFLNVHLFTENGQDIGEELIKAGIVYRCSASITSVAEHGLLVD